MPRLLWDASALTKRYAPEIGTDTVDALFASVPTADMVVTALGYAEAYSILLRKYNRGSISASTFVSAKTLLRDEIVNTLDFTVLTVDDTAVFAGIDLMEAHNINASDSAILATYLSYAQMVGSIPCLLVASDQRLMRAAIAEGLQTLDPENTPAADVPALLASL